MWIRCGSVADDADTWASIVSGFATGDEITYEPVGGINPVDGPVALCVGGTNRLTGHLSEEFWGACCDADEKEVGKLFRKSLVPTAVMCKSHMPDLAKVVPAFNVESIEKSPDEYVRAKVSRKVEFESYEFNQRFLATVPKEYDPIPVRELFSPGFLEWVTTMDRVVEFGINDRQFWFLWHLRERSEAELKLALANAGQLFKRIHAEMEEEGIHHFPPGPWNAGLAPFPAE